MGSQTQQKISEDSKFALKTGDSEALGVLRMLVAAFSNKSIEKRSAFVRVSADKGNKELEKSAVLTEEEVLEILNREVKKRREAAELYKKGNRLDLADKEEKEILVIQKYLPAQMGREEVERVVDRVFATLRQAQGEISFGNFMKEAMKELKGKADSRLISEIIKGKL